MGPTVRGAIAATVLLAVTLSVSEGQAGGPGVEWNTSGRIVRTIPGQVTAVSSTGFGDRQVHSGRYGVRAWAGRGQ